MSISRLNDSFLFSGVVLRSDSVEGSGFTKREFRNEVNRMLVMAGDLKSRRAIFDQSIKLIRREQKSDQGWIYSYWNGYTPATRALIEYGKQTVDDDWSALALVADVLWNQTPYDFAYGQSHEYAEQERFSSSVRETLGLLRPGALLADQLEALSTELGPKEQWGNAAVLLPQFFESCEAVGNPVYIIRFIESADEIYSESGNPFANEFAIAGRMALAAYHHEYTGPGKISEPDKWVAHAEKVLRDQEISIAARLGLARFFTNRLRGKLPKSVLKAAGEVLSEGLNGKQFVNGYTVSNVLRSFNLVEPDAEWRALAGEIIKGWWHTCRLDNQETKHGQCFRPSIDPVLSMLEMILTLNDEDALLRLLEVKNDQIKQSPRAFALLVKYGRFEEAVETVFC